MYVFVCVFVEREMERGIEGGGGEERDACMYKKTLLAGMTPPLSKALMSILWSPSTQSGRP
jgi:hypothetical protein